MFSTGDTWSCDISLQFMFDGNGRPLEVAGSGRVQFGETLYDKSLVEPTYAGHRLPFLTSRER